MPTRAARDAPWRRPVPREWSPATSRAPCTTPGPYEVRTGRQRLSSVHHQGESGTSLDQRLEEIVFAAARGVNTQDRDARRRPVAGRCLAMTRHPRTPTRAGRSEGSGSRRGKAGEVDGASALEEAQMVVELTLVLQPGLFA